MAREEVRRLLEACAPSLPPVRLRAHPVLALQRPHRKGGREELAHVRLSHFVRRAGEAVVLHLQRRREAGCIAATAPSIPSRAGRAVTSSTRPSGAMRPARVATYASRSSGSTATRAPRSKAASNLGRPSASAALGERCRKSPSTALSTAGASDPASPGATAVRSLSDPDTLGGACSTSSPNDSSRASTAASTPSTPTTR
mmetsp:Transcript_7755/g.24730  ORF Transcript_7755/g.24730 Transcript_7755/m.24730 type:complete len:200 (-) Transcript_7755:264-863(-)